MSTNQHDCPTYVCSCKTRDDVRSLSPCSGKDRNRFPFCFLDSKQEFVYGQTMRDIFAKSLLVMTLAMLLLSTAFFSAQASGLSQPITLSGKDIPIKEIISTIEKQTGYVVFYNKGDLQDAVTISLTMKNMPLAKFLETAFQYQPFSYLIEDKTIVLTRKPKSSTGHLTDLVLPSHDISFPPINGRVTDSKGAPLAGASVSIRGKKVKTAISGKDGAFIINADPGDVIEVSFMGFEKGTYLVKEDKNEANIVMKQKVKDIGDVVVTGIFTRKKESFTGAAQSFTGDELKQVGNRNVIQSLRSLDPSIVINENNLSGSNPNRLPQIELRGKTSIDNRTLRDGFTADPNQPLFILDGFETSLRTIVDLDMNRVQSMTLLKDAASTAIYGARAANGVVVVETKKPKIGPMELSYTGDFSLEMPDLSGYNMMNADEKLEFERLSGRYTYFDPSNFRMQMIMDSLYNSRLVKVRQGINSYWLNEPLRLGLTQGHSVRVSGGDNRMRYGAGVRYKKQNGIMKGSGRDTWEGSVNLIYRTERINVYNQLMISGYNAKESPYGTFSNFVNPNPYYPKFNEDGDIERYLESSNSRLGTIDNVPNTMYNAYLNNQNTTKGFSFQNNLQLTYYINTGLQLQGAISVNKENSEQVIFYSPENTQFDNASFFEKGTYSNIRMGTFGYQVNAMLTYGKLIAFKHLVNLNVRAEMQDNRNESYSTNAVGFPVGSNGNPSFSYSYQKDSRPQSYLSTVRRNNFLVSGSYVFDARFVADFSTRLDGSTAFGSNKKYETFWSAGVAWNLDHEPMFHDKSWINRLRIKANTGLTGNQNFSQITSVSVYNYTPSALNTFGQGLDLQTLGNPNLKWQQTLQTNLGLDFTFFNNKLSGWVNFFSKYTDPLIISVDLPASTGLVNYPMNIGNQTNRGIDFSVNFSPIYIPQKRIIWTVGVTGIVQKAHYGGIGNQLEPLNKNEQDNGSLIRYRDGYSPDDLWTVYSVGIDPATGNEVFRQKDGQYTFQYRQSDIVRIGNSRPIAEGVFNNSIVYKGFNLGLYFRYRFGGDVLNTALYNKVENISDAALANNQDRRALYDRWKNPGDITSFKKIGLTGAGRSSTATGTPLSSRFIQEENTLSGESISFGYEFADVKWLQKLGLKTLRANGYMNDIFRLSTIKRERGIDYPFARTVAFSVNASF